MKVYIADATLIEAEYDTLDFDPWDPIYLAKLKGPRCDYGITWGMVNQIINELDATSAVVLETCFNTFRWLAHELKQDRKIDYVPKLETASGRMVQFGPILVNFIKAPRWKREGDIYVLDESPAAPYEMLRVMETMGQPSKDPGGIGILFHRIIFNSPTCTTVSE